jgi:hypothetical protein
MTALVGKRIGTSAALPALAGALCVAVPGPARSDPPISGVDLSQYSLVGRYDRPEPTRTAAPAGGWLTAGQVSTLTGLADAI